MFHKKKVILRKKTSQNIDIQSKLNELRSFSLFFPFLFLFFALSVEQTKNTMKKLVVLTLYGEL